MQPSRSSPFIHPCVCGHGLDFVAKMAGSHDATSPIVCADLYISEQNGRNSLPYFKPKQVKTIPFMGARIRCMWFFSRFGYQ